MEKIKFYGRYRLTKEMLTDAYDVYTKKTIDLRNATVILYFLLAIYFVIFVITQNEEKVIYVLSVVCVALGVITRYNSKKARRNAIEVFDEMIGDAYECAIFTNRAFITTISLAGLTEDAEDAIDEKIAEALKDGKIGEPTVFEFDEYAVIIEKYDYYIMGNDQLFYVLPKSGFKNTQNLSEFFRGRFGKNYSSR